MRLIFWASAMFIIYVNAGYPALLWLRARLTRRPDRPEPVDGQPPSVSIIVAARNEAHHLPARIENLLRLEFPSSLRQIVIVSDGSTDETESALTPYRDVVELVSVPRGGKALALNAAVERARHDVLVFADARQRFASDALIELTRPFTDPSVGGVTGELLLDCEAWRRHGPSDRRTADRPGTSDRRHAVTSTIAAGVGAYWRYEKTLRRLESTVWSTVGATGAIYAMRRSLWSPLPADTILDDVLVPMRAVLAGSRIVFNTRARAFDRVAAHGDAEWARKVRTLAGNFQLLWLEPRLLDPRRNPVWMQFVSHKIGRLFVPYALLALLVSSMALAEQHLFYALALSAQCVAYLLAGYGAWLEYRALTTSQAGSEATVAAGSTPREVISG